MDCREFEDKESGDMFDQIFCHPYLLSNEIKLFFTFFF